MSLGQWLHQAARVKSELGTISRFVYYMSVVSLSLFYFSKYPPHSGPGLPTPRWESEHKPPKKQTSLTPRPKIDRAAHHCGCSAVARPGQVKGETQSPLLHLPCAICRLSSLKTLNRAGKASHKAFRVLLKTRARSHKPLK